MRSIIAAALVAIASPALAQSCANRAEIVAGLAAKYGEVRQAAGLDLSGNMVEVFVSGDTGTWTILVTLPAGVSCIMSGGKHWSTVKAGKGV
ncbi:MAG: hypothetical protein ACPGVA_16825 [Pikeienuella sp.]